MDCLNDLYRNVTYMDQYDERSFIGVWLNDKTWSDKEYWKLDKALVEINRIYPYPTDVPRDICCCVARITQLMMVPNWNDFIFDGKDADQKVGIGERYERLIFVLKSVYMGDELDASHFSYRPRGKKSYYEI